MHEAPLAEYACKAAKVRDGSKSVGRPLEDGPFEHGERLADTEWRDALTQYLAPLLGRGASNDPHILDGAEAHARRGHPKRASKPREGIEEGIGGSVVALSG